MNNERRFQEDIGWFLGLGRAFNESPSFQFCATHEQIGQEDHCDWVTYEPEATCRMHLVTVVPYALIAKRTAEEIADTRRRLGEMS